jgi:alginate O-acetyltransferase complex protein AlgI
VASLCFYAWGEFRYIWFLVAVVAANYSVARLIERRRGRSRTLVLWLGVGANLAGLVAFKYVGLANYLLRIGDPILEALGLPGIILKWHPPLGISFFTFKAISYLVDVKRKDVPSERDPLVFATYLTMFPQILAGPISRLADCTREMRDRSATFPMFRRGAECFMIGLAQKLLIANTLATPADAAFSARPADLSAPFAWLGIVCYTLQVYFDFNGYTNMAIGLGQMLGFHFPQNFNYPYTAQSITEFWQRWHITLSTWLRDYLWFPLGANRRGALRTTANLLFVFGICGLWHGASYPFVAWGVFHGTLLALERAGLLSLLSRFGRTIRTGYALTMILAGWVLFRSESLSAASRYFTAMAGLNFASAGATAAHALSPLRFLSLDTILALVFGVLFSYEWKLESSPVGAFFRSPGLSPALRTASAVAVLALFLISLMAIAAGSHNPFLYFRF